jgi:hypothetical protein
MYPFFVKINTSCMLKKNVALHVPNDYKMYQMITKCTKLIQNVPNEYKMCQMVIKYPKSP